MKKRMTKLYICLLLVFTILGYTGCGGSALPNKEWLAQTTVLTDLKKYPCDYLINLDSISFGMTGDEVLNMLEKNGVEFGEVYITEYDDYEFTVKYKELEAEMVISIHEVYEGMQTNALFYYYEKLSREQAHDIFFELEKYYDDLSTMKQVFDDEPKYKRIGYKGETICLYISIHDNDDGTTSVGVTYEDL